MTQRFRTTTTPAPRVAPRHRFNADVWVTTAAVIGIMSAIAFELVTAIKDPPRRGTIGSDSPPTTFRVGDCVMLHSTGIAAPLISKADCGADPSYTVGAIVQADTGCSVPDYVRYPGPLLTNPSAHCVWRRIWWSSIATALERSTIPRGCNVMPLSGSALKLLHALTI